MSARGFSVLGAVLLGGSALSACDDSAGGADASVGRDAHVAPPDSPGLSQDLAQTGGPGSDGGGVADSGASDLSASTAGDLAGASAMGDLAMAPPDIGPPTEVEPNDLVALANNYVAPWVATISPAIDIDYLRFIVPTAGAQIVIATHEVTMGECESGVADSWIELLAGDGNTLIAMNDDAPGAGFCSALTVAAPSAGEYYLRVRAGAAHPMAVFQYMLDISF